jgi:hypothetical protein
LFSNDQDIAAEYRDHFVGMTAESVTLDTLLDARAQLRAELLARLTDQHKTFLIGLARAEPDWSLLLCPYAAELPGLRWKILNLEKFAQKRPADFKNQADELKRALQ